MSYDLSLEIDAGNGMVSIDGADFNITYNMCEFFEWGLGRNLKEFNGKDASDLRDAILSCANRVGSMDKVIELHRFDAPNGWGTVEWTLAWLIRVGIACAKAPNAKVRIS